MSKSWRYDHDEDTFEGRAERELESLMGSTSVSSEHLRGLLWEAGKTSSWGDPVNTDGMDRGLAEMVHAHGLDGTEEPSKSVEGASTEGKIDASLRLIDC